MIFAHLTTVKTIQAEIYNSQEVNVGKNNNRERGGKCQPYPE